MFVALKALHIASMFAATTFAVGPIVVFYLLARAGDTAALRAAMRFDLALERVAGGLYALGIIFGLLAAASGALELTAQWLLIAYGLVVLLAANNLSLSLRLRRLKDAAANGGDIARLARAPVLVVSMAILGLLTLGLIYVMVAKPTPF